MIGVGLNGGTLSTPIRAVGTTIEVTWDNGNVLVTHDLINLDDGHINAVRVWGGSVCWITVNDRMADAKEDVKPVVCIWSRD